MKFNKTSQDYRQLNDFIRGEMKRQKISQDDMAYGLNLTQSVISRKLSGETEWTLWEVLNVFERLGKSCFCAIHPPRWVVHGFEGHPCSSAARSSRRVSC